MNVNGSYVSHIAFFGIDGCDELNDLRITYALYVVCTRLFLSVPTPRILHLCNQSFSDSGLAGGVTTCGELHHDEELNQ